MPTNKTKTVNVKKTEITEITESRFTKEQLLAAARFEDRRDALGAVLSADGTYTVKEAEQLLEDFYKRKVR